MKNILKISALIAILGSPTAFAEIDSVCRTADMARLEAATGVGSSGITKTVQPGERYSITDVWGIPHASEVLNNVSVLTGGIAPAAVRAKFRMETIHGAVVTPWINPDGDEFCFELSGFVHTLARQMPTGITVEFKGAQGEPVSVGIRGHSYIGKSSAILSYSIVDYLPMSMDLEQPKILNFDIPNGFSEYVFRGMGPMDALMFTLMGSTLTLICDDSSQHVLAAEQLENVAAGIKLNIEGLCDTNAALEVTTVYPSLSAWWLLGKR